MENPGVKEIKFRGKGKWGRITYEENSRGDQLTQFESHAPHPLNQERPKDRVR